MATRRGLDGIEIRRACPEDAGECVRLRGLTRENAVSEDRLREYGVTVPSWAADIASGALPGWVARSAGRIVGYGFGAARSGEVWDRVVKAQIPLGRAGTGEDIAHMVVFLCSEQAAWITGQTFYVDGGHGHAPRA